MPLIKCWIFTFLCVCLAHMLSDDNLLFIKQQQKSKRNDDSFIEIQNIVMPFVCDLWFCMKYDFGKWDLLLYSLIKHKKKGHRKGSLIIWIIGPLYHMIWEAEWTDFVLLSDMCQCEAQRYPSCLIKGKSINLSEIVSKNAIIRIRH